MKPEVKRAIGHFAVLVDHSLRPYEPAPQHVLHRMIRPLCRDVGEVLQHGTKNDAWQILVGIVEDCRRAAGETQPAR